MWPPQDASLTLTPVSGRNFEPPAECASESANLLLMMMDDLPKPTAREQRSIRAAASWFFRTAIYGESWKRTKDGRELAETPGAGPVWARFYQTETDRPIFVDRDKVIYDRVNELSTERRNGYQWYGSDGERALERFKIWQTEYSESK